jgi:hypothetical protein
MDEKILVSHKKFPLTTPVGQLRKASADLPHKDILFFAKQGFRWSFKQLDVQKLFLNL